MAQIAAFSEKGPVRNTNQDACCVEVAETPYGEVVMAVVCDGVGGLELGELASSTVVARFSRWFEEELPSLSSNGLVGHSTVRFIWSALLTELNDLIQAHVVGRDAGVGTTFSGIFCHSGRYLVAHVGDSRIYQVGPLTFDQITEDQTLVARELAAGNITPEEARTYPKKNVILQAVGTERTLKPEFYEGGYTANDVFVLCSDGAYKRPGSDGIKMLFQTPTGLDEAAMELRCKTLVEQDIVHGEKDNVTIACFSTDPGTIGDAAAAGESAFIQTREYIGDADDSPTAVMSVNEDDLPTNMMSAYSEDDLPTNMMSAYSEDDLPTNTYQGLTDDDLDTAVMYDQPADTSREEADA